MAKEPHLIDDIPLSGFKYLKEKNKVIRYVWISVIIFFLFLTLYQIVQQVTKYLKYEVSTNIEIEFPKTFVFPTVAICNNNQFRVSYLASDRVRNRKPTDGRLVNRTSLLLSQVLATMHDFPADQFLREAGSQLDDLIHECKLGFEDCKDPKLWRQIWTYEGLCWAFNYNGTVSVSQTGVNSGLKLLLNAEAYESSMNCVDSNMDKLGFRVVVFNQTDAPLSSSEGVSVMPGYSTKIPIKAQQREAYAGSGSCAPETEQSIAAMGSVLADSNIQSCTTREFLRFVKELCNCSIDSLFETSAPTDGFANCDVEMYFACVLMAKEAHKDVLTLGNNSCLPPCKKMEFIIEQDITILPDGILPFHESFLLADDEGKDAKFREAFSSRIQTFQEFDKDGKRVFAEHTKRCDNGLFTEEDFAKLREQYEQKQEIRTRFEDAESRKWNYTHFILKETISSVEQCGYPLMPPTNKTTKSLIQTLSNLSKLNAECAGMIDDALKVDELANSPVGKMLLTPASSVLPPNGVEQFALFNELWDQYYQGTMTLKELAENVETLGMNSALMKEIALEWKEPLIKLMTANSALFEQHKDEFQRQFRQAMNGSEGVDACLEYLEYNMEYLVTVTKLMDGVVTNVLKNKILKDLSQYMELFKYDRNFERQNFAYAYVYLQSNAVEKYTQSLSYTFGSMACDVGGGLGLFLGASVVSVLEIAYALYQHGCCNFKSKSKLPKSQLEMVTK